jgi:hypothetical protein
MIVIVNVAGNQIIGRRSDTAGEFVLEKPKVIGANKDGMLLFDLPGQPQEITIAKKHIFYDYEVVDEELKAGYLRVTTGLVTPTIVSGRN